MRYCQNAWEVMGMGLKRSPRFIRRLFRRWLTMAAVGAVVAGALALSDEETRRQILTKARKLGERVREKLGEQRQAMQPRKA